MLLFLDGRPTSRCTVRTWTRPITKRATIAYRLAVVRQFYVGEDDSGEDQVTRAKVCSHVTAWRAYGITARSYGGPPVSPGTGVESMDAGSPWRGKTTIQDHLWRPRARHGPEAAANDNETACPRQHRAHVSRTTVAHIEGGGDAYPDDCG